MVAPFLRWADLVFMEALQSLTVVSQSTAASEFLWQRQ
jgi:hypothetical protein